MYLMTKIFQEACLVLKYITKPKDNGLTEEKNLSSKNRKIETEFSLSEERQVSETVSQFTSRAFDFPLWASPILTGSGVNIFLEINCNS